MFFIRKLILPVIFLGAAPGLAFTNLIVNGGFEDAPAQNSGDNPKDGIGGTVYYANSVPLGPLNGWTFGYDGTLDGYNGSPEIEWYSDTLKKSWNATPTGGNFAIELNSDSFRGRIYAQASLAQNLVVGQTYALSFDLAPEAGPTSPSAVTAAVMIDGAEHDFSVPPSPTSTWTSESFSFVATSATPTIRFYDGIFTDVNNNFYNDINLDNISLDPTSIPEPSTLFLLGAMLAFMVVKWGWKKRARNPHWKEAI